MFERFTEAARRVIFFARYEASQIGSATIDPEHLLLGLMRRDTRPSHFLQSPDDIASIRKAIESSAAVREKIPTSVDVPLSRDSKLALNNACEEAEALGDRSIDTCHLVLGVMSLETSVAVELLERHGVTLAAYREVVRNSPREFQEDTVFWLREGAVSRVRQDKPTAMAPVASTLHAPVRSLEHLLDHAVENVPPYSESYARQRLKRKPWSRKEGLGHLINLAVAHHQWFATALTEPALTIGSYPEDDWVAAQRYQDYEWPELVDLWIGLNRLLIHVLCVIPEAKLDTPCRIGIEEPIPLLALIERYVRHCENIIGQILARL